MIDLSQSNDLHDSSLVSVEFDVPGRSLTFRVHAYLSLEGVRERTPIILRFGEVGNFSATTNMEDLKQHAGFGNIAEWRPGKGSNFISLAVGAITFEAGGFDVFIAEPEQAERAAP